MCFKTKGAPTTTYGTSRVKKSTWGEDAIPPTPEHSVTSVARIACFDAVHCNRNNSSVDHTVLLPSRFPSKKGVNPNPKPRR